VTTPSLFEIIRPTFAGPEPRPEPPVRLAVDRTEAPVAAPYVLGEELATAVNVALALDQPLLVTGEPGCGKTTLAWAVAEQLGTRVEEFHTKSTSVARDLFYTVDTLRRFHDASAHIATAQDASEYIDYQALGRAYRSSETLVVLIDEIDKAPRDFPNDLLNELDRKEFSVPELRPPGESHFRQKARHFVLITSNSERRLPEPFLRRCAFAHIPFPEPAALECIVLAHTARLSLAPSFVKLAVERFLELRGVEGLQKAPATGELVAWTRVLVRMGIPEPALSRSHPVACACQEASGRNVRRISMFRSRRHGFLGSPTRLVEADGEHRRSALPNHRRGTSGRR
jgi:MoxR-like ATPase